MLAMLVRPSPEALQSLAMLSQSALWRPVAEMLTEELGRTYDLLRESAHDAALRQAQGKAQFLKEFMDLVAKASKI
jgi:hypothetical protein